MIFHHEYNESWYNTSISVSAYFFFSSPVTKWQCELLWSVDVRRPSYVCVCACVNIFFSETTSPCERQMNIPGHEGQWTSIYYWPGWNITGPDIKKKTHNFPDNFTNCSFILSLIIHRNIFCFRPRAQMVLIFFFPVYLEQLHHNILGSWTLYRNNNNKME